MTPDQEFQDSVNKLQRAAIRNILIIVAVKAVTYGLIAVLAQRARQLTKS